jgi:hypothetical protein
LNPNKRSSRNRRTQNLKMLDVSSVFSFLDFAVHCFIYVGQLGLAGRIYNDDDNTFVHLFIVLTIAICCEFPSWQLAENVYKANRIDQ